jgi:hypothetical protein
LISSFEPENCQLCIDEDPLSKLGLTLNDLAKLIAAQPYLFAVFTQDEVAREAAAERFDWPAVLLLASPPAGVTVRGRPGGVR